MEFTYTALNLAEYYRRDTTLRPSVIGREEALQHVTEERLAELEARAAKNGLGMARIHLMSDFEIVVKAVQ